MAILGPINNTLLKLLYNLAALSMNIASALSFQVVWERTLKRENYLSTTKQTIKKELRGFLSTFYLQLLQFSLWSQLCSL